MGFSSALHLQSFPNFFLSFYLLHLPSSSCFLQHPSSPSPSPTPYPPSTSFFTFYPAFSSLLLPHLLPTSSCYLHSRPPSSTVTDLHSAGAGIWVLLTERLFRLLAQVDGNRVLLLHNTTFNHSSNFLTIVHQSFLFQFVHYFVQLFLCFFLSLI